LVLPLLQGIGISFILLIGYFQLQQMGWKLDDIRIGVFTALVLALFLLVLANTHFTPSARLRTESANPWMFSMFGFVSLMLLAVLFIPFLRDIGVCPVTLSRLVSRNTSGACVVWHFCFGLQEPMAPL
jgi:Ca2+-transporting ATPase